MLKIILDYVTFPGVIFHQFSHQLGCKIADVEVIQTTYFSRSGKGYILYKNPNEVWKVATISLAPLIFNSVGALVVGGIIGVAGPDSLFFMPLLWLGFALGFHALPDDQEANNVLTASRLAVNEGGYILRHTLITLLMWILKLINVLRFFWIDLLWTVAVVGIGISLGKHYLL